MEIVYFDRTNLFGGVIDIPQEKIKKIDECFEMYLIMHFEEDESKKKVLKTLSLLGRLMFLKILNIIQLHELEKDLLELPVQKKDNILQSAYQKFEEEIKKMDLSPQKEYEVDPVMAIAIVETAQGFEALEPSIRFFGNARFSEKEWFALLKACTITLPEQERFFLIDYFVKKWSEPESKGEREKVNKHMANLIKTKKMYKNLTYPKAVKLLNAVEKDPIGSF